jgi:hypothetical protein
MANSSRAIRERPGDVASLARRCGSSERGVRILCDYLTVVGLMAKEDGRYRHTPTSAVFLDPRSPASVASAARFLGHEATGSNSRDWQTWCALTTSYSISPNSGFSRCRIIGKDLATNHENP